MEQSAQSASSPVHSADGFDLLKLCPPIEEDPERRTPVYALANPRRTCSDYSCVEHLLEKLAISRAATNPQAVSRYTRGER